MLLIIYIRYNAMNHPVPFMKATNVVAPKKQAKEAPDLEEAIEEEDEEIIADAEPEEDDDEIDFKKDKYIKMPKKKPAAKKKAAAKDDDDGEVKPKKGRPKAKAKK